MKMEQTERSETSEHKFQMPESHPKERIRHSEHGENLKSRTTPFVITTLVSASIPAVSEI
jgi:hypothetical protein